jgi:two-component system phosphate regulon sensor histidine kinase PhoR
MRPWLDKTILIAVGVALLGAAATFGLTGNFQATVAGLLAALVIVVLLFNATEAARATALDRVEEHIPSRTTYDQHGEALSILLEAVPNPLLVIQRGRVAQCNAPALALLGAHIGGEDIRFALRHPAAIDLLKRTSKSTGSTRVDIAGLGLAGQLWEMTVHPLADGRQLVLLADQSERQAAERMRVDFVANASHELRTPLAGILGFIETLRDPDAGADAATRERFLGIMDVEARRMQRLVDDLMSLSRIEAEKYQSPSQPVAVDALAQEVVSVFRQSGNKRAQDIVLEVAPDLPPVCGDRPQLVQLLHNLVSNALKYGAPDTKVTVAARLLPHGMIEISVADRGEGIAPEHLPRLTERFYRVDSSRSRAMGGTGLGLAIVKHIAQRHRGLLHVDSKLGQGSVMRVELPVFVDTGR